jgi:hypothetical protein
MAESVRLLASLAIDGRVLRCDHAVLLRAEPSSRDWLIAVLGVAARDLECLPGHHLVACADSHGESFHGAVEVDPGQLRSYVRLQGAGELLESCGPADRPGPRSYALLTADVYSEARDMTLR